KPMLIITPWSEIFSTVPLTTSPSLTSAYRWLSCRSKMAPKSSMLISPPSPLPDSGSLGVGSVAAGEAEVVAACSFSAAIGAVSWASALAPLPGWLGLLVDIETGHPPKTNYANCPQQLVLKNLLLSG